MHAWMNCLGMSNIERIPCYALYGLRSILFFKVSFWFPLMVSSILVVDDDEDVLKLHRLILEGEGYVIGTASTGKLALEEARKSKYNIAILDMFLPDIRGNEVACELRKMDDSIGIIFITGYDMSLQIVESLNFDFYIFLKPISPEELLNAVENVLSILNGKNLIWAHN